MELRPRSFLTTIVTLQSRAIEVCLSAARHRRFDDRYQKYGNVILLKAKGTLEPRLAELGYKVTWAEFPFGPPLLEAINAPARLILVIPARTGQFTSSSGSDPFFEDLKRGPSAHV